MNKVCGGKTSNEREEWNNGELKEEKKSQASFAFSRSKAKFCFVRMSDTEVDIFDPERKERLVLMLQTMFWIVC